MKYSAVTLVNVILRHYKLILELISDLIKGGFK
jgi:hypothetical protein